MNGDFNWVGKLQQISKQTWKQTKKQTKRQNKKQTMKQGKNAEYTIDLGRRICACILLVLIVCAGIPFVDIQATTTRTVRVGIFTLGQFQYLTELEDGTYEAHGYNVDLLDQIARKNHWQYEYVPCDNWIDATEKLENGEIDLLAPAQITDALQEKFDYAALYMGTESAAIYTKADSSVAYEDFESMDELVYGCAKDSTFAKKFVADYCPDNGMNPTIIYYDNTTELQMALKKGEVDAIVTNIMFASDDTKMLGWYLVLPVYYITQKGNTELLNELDTAMRMLLLEKPSLLAELSNTYFPIYSTTHITSQEIEYREELPEVVVGYEQDHKPLSYTDENGKFAGITRDILDHVSEQSGIKFRYVELPTTNVTLSYLKENKIYVLSNVEYNTSNQKISQMHLSTPYLESEKVLVAKKMSLSRMEESLTIGVPSGSETLVQEIQSVYSNFKVIKYESVKECFDAVNEGKLDGTMVNRYIADCTLENPAYAELEVIPIQSLGDSLCLATIDYGDGSETESLVNDARFISIVDKAISQISTEDRNGFIITNTSKVRYTLNLMDIMRKYRWELAGGTTLLLLIFLLMFHIMIVKQRSAAKFASVNKNLEKAIAKADSANVAKSQFLAQMSHEIRTPMNAIIGLTSIAKMESNHPDKVEEYLVKIDSSSKLLLSIINDVLDMSAIEGGKLKIDSATFNFKQMLTNITTIFYQQAKQKNVQFDVRLDRVSEETIIGDELRVNQILMNLLSNAIKFTPVGGKITLLVIQASHSHDKVQLRFSVSDTGCGMSEDMMKRLFQPFEQESAATARKHGGSGLGLSITKNLVEMMGGSISVKSEIGKGTEFIADIPFGAVENSEKLDTSLFSHIRTLVVDDDEESCKYSGILLERLGVPYNYASTGELALDMLGEAEDENEPYKLCLVDWKMPDMDGVEVTQKIREIFGKDTIVIIVSAYDLNEVEAEAKSVGANYFIPKPLFQSTLFNALMRISQGNFTKLEEKIEAENFDFSGRRILVAEDVALNMEVAIKLLERVGISTTCAEDGQQAVKIFKESAEHYYDCILMDVNMPVMDGYEATQMIRNLKREDAKSTPIYAMTANAFSEDVTAALNAGMNGHIAKPIETAVLYKTLEMVFNKV